MGIKPWLRRSSSTRDVVTLQVFSGTKGISTEATATFLGHPMQTPVFGQHSGARFDGAGVAIDGGPDLSAEPRIDIGGPTVNPAERAVPNKMIRTDVPMIDVFNTLVESQKIPIFSVSGEPFNAFLSRIGIQADADIVVFGGLGLIFDDYHTFRTSFEDAGVFSRTVMFVNQAMDPLVERLAGARHGAGRGREIRGGRGQARAGPDDRHDRLCRRDERGWHQSGTGALRSAAIWAISIRSLARRYEKACDYAKGGSVTVLTVTTMPGNDVTHPVPDNTGYITEGQFYLHSGVIDPFGSLSRLKQNVIGKTTREDHGQIMNTMIRFYSESRDAAQKQAMAFDLSDYDHQLLKFGALFRKRFMDINVSIPLEEALDLGWKTLAECFAAGTVADEAGSGRQVFPEGCQWRGCS